MKRNLVAKDEILSLLDELEQLADETDAKITTQVQFAGNSYSDTLQLKCSKALFRISELEDVLHNELRAQQILAFEGSRSYMVEPDYKGTRLAGNLIAAQAE